MSQQAFRPVIAKMSRLQVVIFVPALFALGLSACTKAESKAESKPAASRFIEQPCSVLTRGEAEELLQGTIGEPEGVVWSDNSARCSYDQGPGKIGVDVDLVESPDIQAVWNARVEPGPGAGVGDKSVWQPRPEGVEGIDNLHVLTGRWLVRLELKGFPSPEASRPVAPPFATKIVSRLAVPGTVPPAR